MASKLMAIKIIYDKKTSNILFLNISPPQEKSAVYEKKKEREKNAKNYGN